MANSLARRAGFAAPSLPWLRHFWFLGLAALVFAVPALIGLGRQVWSTEQGAHGPIILATGIWLLIREAKEAGVRQRPGGIGLAVPIIIVSIATYLFARMTGTLWLEWFAVYVTLVAILLAYVGRQAIRQLWFPLFYLLFLVPPPYAIIAPTTRALKLGISAAAADVLAPLGYSVASSGTTLYIDQYELLVEAACSGLNSLVSLLAIGLFYIYLRHRADWRYALLLALMVVPIAIFANFTRVVLLLLITHYFGDAVGQGMFHEAAGMTMFFVALGTLILLDQLLTPLCARLSRRKQA